MSLLAQVCMFRPVQSFIRRLEAVILQSQEHVANTVAQWPSMMAALLPKAWVGHVCLYAANSVSPLSKALHILGKRLHHGRTPGGKQLVLHG